MGSIEKYTEANLVFIVESGNEVNPHSVRHHKLTDEMVNWFYSIKEDGFLLKADGEIGFMCVMSEHHKGQTESSPGHQIAVKHGSRTSLNVFDLVEEAASQLAPQTPEPCMVYVGAYSGQNLEHEICLFFPFGTDVRDISNASNLAKEIMQDLTWKKWQSFVDLIEG